MTMAETTIPKQERLLKLLRMTTSPNDGEALTALRMATKLLDDSGWTWDMLINRGITVVADPFGGGPAFDPFANDTRRQTPTAPPPRRPAAPPPPSRPVSRPFRASPGNPISTRQNAYVGFCYCCGVEVVAQKGFYFLPSDKNPAASMGTFAKSRFAVVCTTCNTSGTVYDSPTGQRPKARGKANISDLI